MNVRILRAEGRPAAPWSNGGGVTREVAVHPPGAGWDTFAWRVSLADVTRDGPYSPLPGVRRILTVVDGAGLELTVDGTTRLLPDRCRPFAFPGGADTGSRLLDGPVVNLNVMLREGRADAVVEMVRGHRVVEPVRRPAGGGADGPEAVLVVAVEGPARLRTADGPAVRLARFDAALLAGPDAAPAEVWTDGTAAVIALSAADPARSEG
ncbi:HutD family protein [Streptomyces sp. WAC01526]|uniref:HutD/Ves family protein n=1 Tax=Streptomyces sp. WAC01526 TaxID=2588709 RepID=UPI0011DF58F3|nr:HutD family protein [Streptomyces sp. WAC01526]